MTYQGGTWQTPAGGMGMRTPLATIVFSLVLLMVSGVVSAGPNDAWAVTNLVALCGATGKSDDGCTRLKDAVRTTPNAATDVRTAKELLFKLGAEAALHPTFLGGFLSVTLDSSEIGCDVLADCGVERCTSHQRAQAAKLFLQVTSPNRFATELRDRPCLAGYLIRALQQTQ